MGFERATATWWTLPADGAPGHVFQNRGGSVREKQKQETGITMVNMGTIEFELYWYNEYNYDL
jgi:hypothetical protein